MTAVKTFFVRPTPSPDVLRRSCSSVVSIRGWCTRPTSLRSAAARTVTSSGARPVTRPLASTGASPVDLAWRIEPSHIVNVGRYSLVEAVQAPSEAPFGPQGRFVVWRGDWRDRVIVVVGADAAGSGGHQTLPLLHPGSFDNEHRVVGGRVVNAGVGGVLACAGV